MPDRPTLQHSRLQTLEIGGRPLEITSAELVDIQYWDGDHPAQQEWELNGRTTEDRIVDGVVALVMTIAGKRRRGRGVASSSRTSGLTVFNIVGLDPLTDVRDPG